VPRNSRARGTVGSLDGPSKTIIVEPLRIPAAPPLPPPATPEREPERSKPVPEKEPVPAR
jgi:hypothetical protein